MSLDAGGVPASLILCVVSPLAQADEQGGQVVLSASLTPEGEELSMLRLADSEHCRRIWMDACSAEILAAIQLAQFQNYWEVLQGSVSHAAYLMTARLIKDQIRAHGLCTFGDKVKSLLDGTQLFYRAASGQPGTPSFVHMLHCLNRTFCKILTSAAHLQNVGRCELCILCVLSCPLTDSVVEPHTPS